MRYSIVQGMLLWGLSSALPAVEKARSLDLFATADVYVANDYPTDLTISSSSGRMDKALPQSFVVPHGQTSPAYRIEATIIPFVQSSFGVTLNSSPNPSHFNFNLGKIAEKTGVSADPKNPQYQSEAVLAPQNPFGGSPDYNFYILGGQNMLAPVINSVIGSKIPALATGLASNPIKPTLPIKGVELAINGIPTDIKATYAGVRSMTGTKWNVNAVLTVTGTISGSLTIDALGGVSIPGQVQLNNFKALANIDINPATFKLNINSLATSLDGLNISSDWLGALNKITPALFRFLHAADDICGVINTDYNSQILALANGALANISLT